MSFHLGGSTLKVSAKLFGENRSRLLKELKQKAPKGSVVVLEGGKDKKRYNTDADDLPFRQVRLSIAITRLNQQHFKESYFFWTFGVHEDDCYGIIDVDSGKSILFPPKLHPDWAIWQGK